jgi:hypothetical protein
MKNSKRLPSPSDLPNTAPLRARLARITFALAACACGVLSSNLRADETWEGGDGTWDFNHTASWNTGSATWTTNNQVPDFTTTPGTVTVDDSQGQVGANFLYFNSSSPTSSWDVAGQPVDLSIAGNGSSLVLFQDGNSGNVTIDAPLNIDTTLATDRYNIYSNAAASVTINGNVTLGAQTLATYNSDGNVTNTRSLIVGSSSNSTVFYLNGTFSDSAAGSTPASPAGVPIALRLAEGGATQDTYIINGDVSGLHGGVEIGSGNMVIDPTANLGTGTLNMYDDQDSSAENVAILAAKGATVSNYIYISMKYHSDGTYGNGTVGAYDASSVTFTGGIGLDNSGAILTAVDGGRATFTGDIVSHSPNGLSKTGAGTVVLASNNDYTLYNEFNSSVPGSTAFDIKQGTLLINNAKGTSPFGNNSGVIKIEGGATLGGSGYIQNGYSQMVVAESATSVIAPGEGGQANLGIFPSFGTLTLAGGLSVNTANGAAGGLTLDFKLDSARDVDQIDMQQGALTLTGLITVNLTSLDGGVETTSPYTLIQGTGDWSGSTDPDFDFIAPEGYTVSSYTFGVDPDLPYSDFQVLNVSFAATPEPSTYGLLGLGLLGLIAVRRFRRLNG